MGQRGCQSREQGLQLSAAILQWMLHAAASTVGCCLNPHLHMHTSCNGCTVGVASSPLQIPLVCGIATLASFARLLQGSSG